MHTHWIEGVKERAQIDCDVPVGTPILISHAAYDALFGLGTGPIRTAVVGNLLCCIPWPLVFTRSLATWTSLPKAVRPSGSRTPCTSANRSPGRPWDDVRMGFQITNQPSADEVLDEYPFALVIGMMLDQQYGIEHAFRGGWKVLSRFGTLDPAAIAAADPETFTELCRQPPAIHRYPGSMAARLQELAALVESRYDGDVTRLWTQAKTGDALLARIQELPGFGKQKAQIFVALLAKQLDVRPRRWKTVAGDYGLKGYRSVADVVDPESLQKVRAYKKKQKSASNA